MQRWLATTLVVLSSAAVLVLEVLVTRLVAPYVGLTLETYTAAIGVALAAIAGGAALGGWAADVLDPRRWLGPALVLSGALVLLARPAVLLVGSSVRGYGPVGTVALVLLAVAPAALVLSTVPPGVVKLQLRVLAETGRTVGRLSALGTLGALAGTFLTGTVLLASLPVPVLLLGTGGVLVATGIGCTVALGRRDALVGPLVVALLAAVAAIAVPGPCDVDTRYYCASIVVDPAREGGRTLVLDGLRHSYVDLDDPAHLEFAYTRSIGDVLAVQRPGPLQVLHLGLGAGTVPRHLQAVRPGSRSTVLEVDPQVVELDRDRLGLVTGPGLTVEVADARTAIARQPSGAFDVVVGDAFGGLAVPWHLATREMVQEVRRVLAPGGTYVLNVVDQPPLDFARAEAATLGEPFAHVALLAPPAVVAGRDGGNLLLVASDRPLDLAGLREAGRGRGSSWVVAPSAPFAGDARVLTDDFAPVDQLLTPYRVASRRRW